MKIFYSALVIMSVVILFMLPIGEAVYDFRTNIKQDSYFVTTGTEETSISVTLKEHIYNNDLSTVSILSDLYTDTPALTSYNPDNRRMEITGLTTSGNRSLTVSYDYDSLKGWDSINVILDRLSWFWLLVVILLAPAALVSLWVKRE